MVTARRAVCRDVERYNELAKRVCRSRYTIRNAVRDPVVATYYGSTAACGLRSHAH